jgi:hypothetical protein
MRKRPLNLKEAVKKHAEDVKLKNQKDETQKGVKNLLIKVNKFFLFNDVSWIYFS